MRIIFYGTPDFAVPSLQKLAEHHQILAVVTAPDRPAGRGRKPKPSAVKAFALEQGWEILQPTNLKSDDFQADLKRLNPEVQVVIAFRMMPKKVWDFPPQGTINLHASYLPDYRGAAPINHAIINGETWTGVSTFRLQHEIDTGDILMREKVEILPTDNVGTLHDKLMMTGADLIVNTLNQLEKGALNPIPQTTLLKERSNWNEAPKIFKEDLEIDWNQPAVKIHNLIRGLSPYPAAKTQFDGKTFKVFTSEFAKEKKAKKAGKISVENGQLFVDCLDVQLQLTEIQIEGKKRMHTADFLRGINAVPDSLG